MQQKFAFAFAFAVAVAFESGVPARAPCIRQKLCAYPSELRDCLDPPTVEYCTSNEFKAQQESDKVFLNSSWVKRRLEPESVVMER